MEIVEELPISEVPSLCGDNDYVEDTATALNLIRKRPPKFRLVISDACTGVQMGDIGIDEMIEEEAKAKSYKALCEAAVAFSDGEYVGKLFRWMPDSGLWQDVSAPVISCNVVSSDVILTVPRIRYNKECRLLNELHEASNTLGIIQQQAASDGTSQMLGPSSIEDRFRVIKQALKTLYVEYRPEYLDAHSLAGLISRINRAFELIQSCSSSVVEYTQVSTAQVGVVQMLISDLLFAASR